MMNLNFVTDLTHLSLITIEGDKATHFLQGQLTCDINRINHQQSLLAAHCSPKGRVLATLRVIQYQNNLQLWLPHTMVDITVKLLKKYAQLSRVTLTLNPEIVGIGCFGETIGHNLVKELGSIPPVPDQVVEKDNVLLIRTRGKYPRFEILGPRESLNALGKKLIQHHLRVENEVWRLLDIQAKIPMIYPSTMDLFTPHMLNYPALNGVSFTKGCYIGQEVIARTQYLGKVKRQPYFAALHTATVPLAGDALHNATGQEVGTVLDAIASGKDSCHLLAVIQDEALATPIFCPALPETPLIFAD